MLEMGYWKTLCKIKVSRSSAIKVLIVIAIANPNHVSIARYKKHLGSSGHFYSFCPGVLIKKQWLTFRFIAFEKVEK